MLKIKKAYMDFMKDVLVGQRAYFIELDSFGYKDKEEDVAMAAASFPLVYIHGEEPFKQNKEVAELCKLIQKSNPYTKIVIETDGSKRPIGMNTIKSVKYFVKCKTKKSGVPFEERVNENAWNWLSKAGAFFIFTVVDKDDFEEINTIISALTIKKHQIYVEIQAEEFSAMAFLAINFGFNIYVKYDGDWIEKETDE